MVTASLSNFRIAPRKMRLVASLIQGKSVTDATNILSVTTKHASEPLLKLLNSALANARNLNISVEGLFVKECRVDGGLTMKRHMPGARGTAFAIRKKTSHVSLLLAPKTAKGATPKAEEKVVAPKTEKPVAKKAPAKKPKAVKKAQ